jgi:hypothetical protein
MPELVADNKRSATGSNLDIPSITTLEDVVNILSLPGIAEMEVDELEDSHSDRDKQGTSDSKGKSKKSEGQ